MNLRQTQGFTMIELIMVIVILGVLSAFALPRFADLGGSARAAAIEGLAGSMRSAIGITRAKWLADGSDAAATTINLDGVDVKIARGYPIAGTATPTVDVLGIIAAAGLPDTTDAGATPGAVANYSNGDYTFTNTTTGTGATLANTLTITVRGGTSCEVAYTNFPTGTTPPTITVKTDDC